jgi:hypothetical protein
MTTQNFSAPAIDRAHHNSQKDLAPAISRLSHQTTSVREAVERFQSLIAEEIGGATLLVEPLEEGVSTPMAKSVSEFMESREFPFRGLYTAPLLAGNRRVGRLIACFGSFGMPGDFLPELTLHMARQLGEILTRTHAHLTHLEAA